MSNNRVREESLLRLLKTAGAELCSNKCESVKHEDRPWRHCPECEEITAAIADLLRDLCPQCPNCDDGRMSVSGDGCLWCDRCEVRR